jgi:hypothetical protein
VCSSEIDLVIVALSSFLSQTFDNDTSTEACQEGGSAQDLFGWAHGSLDIQCEVPVRYAVPRWIIDVRRRGS